MSKPFVGFGRSSDWLTEVDRSLPVNAECVEEAGRAGKYGMSVTSVQIVVSQVNNGEVLYFMCQVDEYVTINGQIMGSGKEEESHQRRAKTAYDLTLAWLSAARIYTRKAIIATPKNYKMLRGVQTYMKYDKESDSYVPVTNS